MTLPLDQETDAILYRVCGLTISCDLPLPELAPVAHADQTAAVDIRAELSGRRAKPSLPAQWFMTWSFPSGELWSSSAKIDGGYLLRFHDLADFTVDPEGRTIVCFPERDTPEGTLRHLLLDQVVPLVLTLRGHHALHATAVLTPHGVCAFTGPTGTGKSTLAASFLVEGYPVLSDDCLVLYEGQGRIMATPSYPGLRLWEDTLEQLGDDLLLSLPVAHYTSKRRPVIGAHRENFPRSAQPVAGVYSLMRPTTEGNESGTPRIERLSPRTGFMELVAASFLLDITDRTLLLQQFRFLSRLVSRVPVRRVHVPNCLASLPATREAILKDLTDG